MSDRQVLYICASFMSAVACYYLHKSYEFKATVSALKSVDCESPQEFVKVKRKIKR